MATTQDYINQLKADKQNLVTMLNNMGVEATNNETFTSLTPKVGKIVTDPILQNKSITITENGTTNIVADEGYDGLGNVEVNTNISSSEGGIETGIIAKSTSEGYVTELETFGFTDIPTSYMRSSSTTTDVATMLSKATLLKLNEGIEQIYNYGFYNAFYNASSVKVVFPSTLKQIGKYAFYGCTGIKDTELPESVWHINSYAFYNCANLNLTKLPDGLTRLEERAFGGGGSAVGTKLTIKTIPDGVTSLNAGVFMFCYTIIQLSMNNVKSIEASSSTSGAFYNCIGLKAVWIGSKITSISQYAFNKTESLIKMFIDKPRATIEAMAGYSKKFGATNATIICNDDEGFMTKEEFDAIDWATYTL